MGTTKDVDAAPVHAVVICFRVIAIPLLIVLYVGAAIPLTVRQLAHRVTYAFDWAFDKVAKLAGWDCSFWPLPKASDNSLPWEDR